jgi:hypothetical protein
VIDKIGQAPLNAKSGQGGAKNLENTVIWTLLRFFQVNNNNDVMQSGKEAWTATQKSRVRIELEF